MKAAKEIQIYSICYIKCIALTDEVVLLISVKLMLSLLLHCDHQSRRSHNNPFEKVINLEIYLPPLDTPRTS